MKAMLIKVKLNIHSSQTQPNHYAMNHYSYTWRIKWSKNQPRETYPSFIILQHHYTRWFTFDIDDKRRRKKKTDIEKVYIPNV